MRIPSLRHIPALAAALQQQQAWTLQQQISICEIPAPSFKEAARAEEFRKRMVALGYTNTRIDSEGNVISSLGQGNGPALMIAGHLDTVSPEGTNVTTPRTGAGSTDSNLPIAMGIPAITISGGGRSGGAHGTAEWYEETPDSYKAAQFALLIITLLAGIAGTTP